MFSTFAEIAEIHKGILILSLENDKKYLILNRDLDIKR